MKKIFSILYCFISIGIFAQTGDGLPNSEIEIIKSFNARLAEARMLDIPLPAHSVDTNRAFIRSYKLSEQPITLEYPAPKIKPLAMPQDENPVNRPFYAKLGYGLQNNPFAELAYYYASDKFNLLANGSYESMTDLDIDDKKFQDWTAAIQSNIYLGDMLRLSVGASYLQENRWNYPETNIGEIEGRFDVTTPQFSLGLNNVLETSSNIDYALNYDYRNTTLTDIQDVKENHHNINGSIKKTFGDGDFQIGLSGLAQFNSLQHNTDIDLNTYQVGLNAGYHQSKWKADVGLDVAFVDEETRFLPQARIDVIVSPLVRPYIGVRSHLEQNNLFNLSRENIFLDPRLSESNNHSSTEIFLGSMGETENGDYEISAGYALHKNQALFVNDYQAIPRFLTVYDDINTLTIGLKGGVRPIDGLRTGAGIAFLSYNTDMESEAWHLPTFTWNLSATYDKLLKEKLDITAQFNSLSGMKYQEINLDTETLDAIIYFELLFDYSISEKFEAFIHLNNLLDNKKARYHQYDLIGINPQLGIKMRL